MSDIKSQLYSYYLDLLNEISNNSTQQIHEYQNLSYKNVNISELIENIKNATSELIKLKISQIELKNKIKNINYSQLENYIKKLEYDIRIFYHKIFEYKIQKNSL